MITLEFRPWRSFRARKRQEEISRWLWAVAMASQDAFLGGMKFYPPASRPGAWPHIRSGALRGSIRTVVTSDSATIGSNVPYSIYLRTGTWKMGRRKMSDDALKEGMTKARLGRWIEWTRT